MDIDAGILIPVALRWPRIETCRELSKSSFELQYLAMEWVTSCDEGQRKTTSRCPEPFCILQWAWKLACPVLPVSEREVPLKYVWSPQGAEQEGSAYILPSVHLYISVGRQRLQLSITSRLL